MAELPITYCTRIRPSSGQDGYHWRVGLEEDGDVKQLVVQLSDSQAIETGLGTTGLDEPLPAALQRVAAGRLRDASRSSISRPMGQSDPAGRRALPLKQRHLLPGLLPRTTNARAGRAFTRLRGWDSNPQPFD